LRAPFALLANEMTIAVSSKMSDLPQVLIRLKQHRPGTSGVVRSQLQKSEKRECADVTVLIRHE
jgi:hypothetical protein